MAEHSKRGQSEPAGRKVHAPAEPGVPAPVTDAQSSAAGRVVNGKFRILAERAASDGELRYPALHLGTGRRVELRLLTSGVSAGGPEAARMLRAARAAGRAPHLNVLNVVDSGLDAEQRPFVVYEQFGGVPCSELLARDGACELRRAADIVSQVLDGLSALHARGVVHRQLRAESVLVEEAAGDVRVKLTGLGFSAREGEREDAAPELPRGFSRYLAPEARRGEQLRAPTLDLYAAGVLLRCLITGDSGPTQGLPTEVAQAIARATADDPDERFQTAAQFRACIGALAGPSARESLLPSGSLQSDLRFLHKRKLAEDEGAPQRAPVTGKLELFAVLLTVESLYARLGNSGWRALLAQVPEVELLLPAAGRGAEYRSDGVPHALVARMLSVADASSGRSSLRSLVELGEELARRGLARFCAALPAELTPESLVACVPVLWRSIVRAGEVLQLEQRGGYARLSVRAPSDGTLELSALFAGLLRGQLRSLSAGAEVNLSAAQALGDGADILVLSW